MTRKIRMNRKKIILLVVFALFMLVFGTVIFTYCSDRYEKKKYQKEQIAKVQNWFTVVNNESGKNKLLNVYVNDEEKYVQLEYKLSGKLENAMEEVSRMQEASNRYLQEHQDDPLSKNYEIGIIFRGSYRYSVKLGLFNYNIDAGMKADFSELNFLQLDMRYQDDLDCSMLKGIKGLELENCPETSCLYEIEQFQDLCYLQTDYQLSQEEWQWCREHGVNCLSQMQSEYLDNEDYDDLYPNQVR